MKNLPIKIDIPILTEKASDLEIKTAWKDLCELQRELKERQNNISSESRIFSDKYDLIKKNIFFKINHDLEFNSSNDKAAEEKSREVMKSLSSGKEILIGEQGLLSEVAGWRSK